MNVTIIHVSIIVTVTVTFKTTINLLLLLFILDIWKFLQNFSFLSWTEKNPSPDIQKDSQSIKQNYWM